MMNGHEKSNSAIVATKLPNKTGKPAAEAVERKAGTKGNTGQHSTRRTQIRESVSQALDRVRKAARQRKKEKFTALLHHISVETLEVAFYALKRKAAPGVDGVTWQDYEADLERRLIDLHGRVHRGVYGPPVSPDLYSKGGRPAAALGDCRPGRQNRPGCDRFGAECDLRGRFSSGSPTGSVPEGERTMRWMPWRSRFASVR